MNKNILSININNLIYNVSKIKETTKKQMMAVIKSNAYNLNSRIILKYLQKIGVNFFVFNHYEEYIYCADLLEKSDVLILETVDYKYIKNIPYNVCLSVNEVTYINKLKELNKKVKVHIQVDTAMNRDGIKSIDELKDILTETKESLIEIEGIYTHFVSDKDEYLYYNKQQEKFKEFLKYYNFPIIHTAATSSLTKDLIGNFVRVGMAMYGHHTNLKLKNVVNAFVKINKIREVKKGECIGYGATYISEKDEAIAVIPVGYYEGFKERFVYKGKKVLPVVGRICMNHTFVLIDKTIKNSSWLNIFPINDKINKEVNYYHILTGYRNFKRIYIMEYQNDIRKIFKETNKKSFKLKQRTRSN